MKFSLPVVLLASVSANVVAWAPLSMPSSTASRITQQRSMKTTALKMAIDYNDPVVAEEFNNVQPLSYEEVEEELLQSGIRAPADMNEMEVKLMLVEVRLRMSGKIGDEGGAKKQKPTTFSSKFEEALWTKPAFEEYFNSLKAKGDHNAMNAVTEYLNDPETAKARYEKTYRGVLRAVDTALSAPPPVKSSKVVFSGFPANMGEQGCRMTLESIGEVTDFECSEDDDFPVLKGTVTFDDIEAARKAIEQYNGMDMGMGTALELTSV